MKELLDMFLTFARIGGFTFGGGYAMLPMLQKEVVSVHRVSSRSTQRRLSVIRIGEFRGRLRRHWESLRRRLSSL